MNKQEKKAKPVRQNGHKVGAVMVVGGGIAGMQSALDLANSGFKVYLVEETTSVGGRMSQLDKTFPTNDCAMCMISPKLIEVSKHINIELISAARVQSVEGNEGDFKVKVLKKPRFIDTTKCTSCGDCADACPVVLSNEFELGLNNRKATFKRYPQAIPSAFAISKTARPPCKITCPAGCNGQGYVALISQGKYVQALDHIKQWIPLPGSLGRICHHPCEQQCNRKDVEQPIAIAPLKRFAADIVRKGRAAGTIPPEEKTVVIDPAKPKVAVVGSGPSGIACAHDLAKLGYPVTIFEANSTPGGQLQTAIPKYRLPKEALAEDINEIIGVGIDLKLNTPIGGKLGLSDLKAQGYQAVYLAIGAQKSRGLPIPGADLPQVLLALDFLRNANEGKPTGMGKRVVVIGGGNVAMDVARTARRLGAADVRAVCLESWKEMPAHAWEIEEAQEEGVKIENSWGPKQVLATAGKVSAIEFEKCLAVFDSERKFNPTFDKKTIGKFDCDTVIIAIGQATDLLVLPAKTNIKNNRGWLVSDPVTLATAEAGVFAGGDAVTGPKSAVEAIAHGHEAATSIDRFLRGADLKEGREKVKQEPAPVPAGEHKKKARVHSAKISLEARVSSFAEIEACYTEDEAKAESQRCMNCGLCSECLQCVAACRAKAVDHTQKEELVELNVGSIVAAPGFEPFDARIKGEYGYGVMPNVVTSLEFERILSASGPFQGKVLRRSDAKHPVKIAWIQCVGSRDETCGKEYCSSVCCMYATKQAIIAREHDSHIQPTIFYNDIRAYGKGFERYYDSAQAKFGVRYVKSIVSAVKEKQQSKNLLMEYTGEDGKKVQEEFDMVVLSVGLTPSAGSQDLAQKLSLDLDRFGFCATEELQPNVTSRQGVYVAGAFEAPMDIPESVMRASSAAFLASEGISEARGTLVTQKEYPPEVPLDTEQERVGVFICRCGSNIARVVDVPGVADYAKTLPNVVHAEENLYTCSTDTQKKIIQAIKDKNLNRVVVASCSPRTHEPLFQDTIREAGLNKYLFEMANIRDQCSWVHGNHMPEATYKAKDLVRMAVARSITLEPLHESPADIKRTGLVIGGGLAGMTAALGLASQGFETVLVEREKELGGNLKHLYYTLEGSDPQALLKSLLDQIKHEPKIKVYTGAQIEKTSGYIGNYKTLVRTSEGKTDEIDHGVIILATGATEYRPTEYLYGKSDKVLTQHELEEKIGRGSENAKALNSVVMIQCVGSREADHLYCSRVCCSQAVKNAIKIKDSNPDAEVYVLYRDIRTYGMKELKYREAREKGVTFIRYTVDKKPEVTEDNGKLKVKVFDSVLGADIVLEPDRLVLSSAVRPQADASEFASKLKLPLTQDGFYMEAHMKLRPLDFVNDGMYVCGLAHAPKFVSESLAQARGAVSRAITVLSKPHLMVGGVISVVDQDRCVACLTCVRSCPFNVPKVNEKGVAYIEAAACQGCGICASSCPRKAIGLQHYKDAQVLAKMKAMCSA